MSLIRKLNQRLKEKYWYSERVYQYVVSGIIGWGFSFFLLILWLLKQV